MLEGSLETFPLPSVVRLIGDTGQTGRLSVHAALGQGSFVFERGRVIDAGPGSDPIEAALALFDHRIGTFSFRVEPATTRILDLDVPRLLDLHQEREAAWEEIRRAIPQDGPLVVVPLDADRPDGEVTVTAEAWRVAVMANGRTTAQLASVAGMSEFRACGVLVELLEGGLIGLGSHRQQAPRRPVPALEEEAEAIEEAVTEIPQEEVDPTLLLRELGEAAPSRPAAKRRLSRR